MAGAPLRPAGTILAMETSWDDSLPLRVGGFDPLGGIYRLTNLDLFEPDTAAKRDRMLEVLAGSDYLVISSNRAYDAMPRLPLRYPMTLKYYQALFGCEEALIIHCAYPAQEGLKGPLGYELIAVFESNPTIGGFEFSDQAAEEAFTVYDHPKVMIFKRAADYSPEYAAEVLNSVDLTEVLDQGPAHYTAMPTALKLPPDRLAAQTQGGTWSDLFDPYGLLNWYQPFGVVAWYLLLLVVGWLAWPVAFVVLRGLPDRGYPLAKFIGLLIITWLAWFAGSYKLLMFTRATLWFIVVLLTCLGGLVALRNWAALSNFTRSRRNYILLVEAFTLALFLFFLWIRWLNPDLWHPWLGGEKPADYSFFQSAIRSVYFPPYDPWLAGRYVNYYYYSFVLAAVPTKLLGIVPAVAYNLALPTLFAFAGIGAFCAAYNLAAEAALTSSNENRSVGLIGMLRDGVITNRAVVAGLAATVMMVLLGNFYQIRQLWRYLPEAADPPAPYGENVIENTFNVLGGGWRVLTGQAELPGEKGRWYFGPSRAILHDGPDTPITEFPLFSFLYADLHPHLVSMSLMLAALAWMMSLAFSARETGENADAPPGAGRRWALFEAALFWFVGGLIVGALQPTHTWDYPGFMLLGVFTIVASVWLKERTISRPVVQQMAGGVALFVGFALVLYYPYRQWFATDFSSIEFWKFTRTPLTDYFTVHGLFLFIIVTWLIWESRSWRKAIPTDYLLRTPLGELLPRIRTPLIIAGV
ncbi:MAG TPA: DUF2298 domain-containing protein, partial [Anaerolineales bacterium]|nr:DUF2298 domain-containing protein [Anaerolineales bacterium]